ncbi:O-acetyl-ADP-ribose deacetylase [Streptacidiphilus jiangxiensis]|uniref:O-acetyl-ADP-ribose deacetylase (Regulator of RNase III), contains Macro domain n=1 Tax=Streptacidiphilus jiangxiensis TaxID=235985 RepID=A0A1H7Y0Y4_STRJI|nr:O-acetyl-ADP-ribose deacetylase [Streptacidiphilus jiangxiensis]SEM39856.1 O-acetyl-ADP-ribose deacetylase (regulator of RNase III), contains Macro domain [Streptacidiphilus jiangxiensis]
MEITLTQGDITRQRVDAIVNAANSSLLGGGGVDGAIHRAGGPEILAACRALRAGHYGKGLPTGQAVATTAGRLPARWVIHTVGPVHPRPEDGAPELARRTELLASCYRESLRIAAELGARSVALPAVSTGVYGWPMESAARTALGEVLELERKGSLGEALDEARFVLFGADAYGVFEQVLQELSHGPMVD